MMKLMEDVVTISKALKGKMAICFLSHISYWAIINTSPNFHYYRFNCAVWGYNPSHSNLQNIKQIKACLRGMWQALCDKCKSVNTSVKVYASPVCPLHYRKRELWPELWSSFHRLWVWSSGWLDLIECNDQNHWWDLNNILQAHLQCVTYHKTNNFSSMISTCQ